MSPSRSRQRPDRLRPGVHLPRRNCDNRWRRPDYRHFTTDTSLSRLEPAGASRAVANRRHRPRRRSGERGRGLGARVTAAWARAVSDLGRLPMYSTAWDNAASLAIARKLQLIMSATDWSVYA